MTSTMTLDSLFRLCVQMELAGWRHPNLMSQTQQKEVNDYQTHH